MNCKSILPLTVAALLLISSCSRQNQPETARSQAVPVMLAPVETVSSSRPVRCSGRLEASAQMKLSFKIGGLVDAIPVNNGDAVQKGQLLAQLRLDEIDAQVTLARAGLDKARRDLQRAENLYADSVATLEQLQNARTATEVAQAQLNIASFNRNHARIHAPSQGHILMKLAEPHELIGAGQPVLVFASESAQWQVQAGVNDVDVVTLKPGNRAEITVDAYPHQILAGKISEIGGAPDPQNGTYPLTIILNGSDALLKSGMVARVTLHPDNGQTCRAVPLESLVDVHDRQAFVYTVSDSGTACKVPVLLEYFDASRAYLSEGLAEIDSVITRGAAYLSDRAPVKVTRPEGGKR